MGMSGGDDDFSESGAHTEEKSKSEKKETR